MAISTAQVDRPVDEIGYEVVERRLCAAVHLDPAFRDFTLKKIYNQRFRWVAPSYGFDLVPILRHAWRAWWAETLERLLLAGIVIVALVQWPYETALLGTGMVCGFFCWKTLGLTAESARRTRQKLGIRTRARRTEQRRKPGVQNSGPKDFRDKLEMFREQESFIRRGVKVSAVVFAVALFAAWRHDGESYRVLTTTGLIAGSLVLVVVVGAVVGQVELIRLRYRPITVPDKLSGRLTVIKRQQSDPRVIYSSARPFIGAGVQYRPWSMVQRLLKTDGSGDEFDTPPFTTEEIVGSLETAIDELRSEAEPEVRLPGLHVSERIFIEGVRGAFLRVHQGTDTTRLVEQVRAEPGGPERHYLVCEVVSWGGELVTLIFVHISLQGRTLYIQFVPLELRQTADRYHFIDEPGGVGPGAVIGAIGVGIGELPAQMIGLWRLAAAVPMLGGALLAWRGPQPPSRRGVDIGARVSAREEATGRDHDRPYSRRDEAEENQFQTTDVVKHVKIIQRRLLSTVEQFLADHDVDTSEFNDTAVSITNSGIVVWGNDNTVNAGGTPSGQGSQQ